MRGFIGGPDLDRETLGGLAEKHVRVDIYLSGARRVEYGPANVVAGERLTGAPQQPQSMAGRTGH